MIIYTIAFCHDLLYFTSPLGKDRFFLPPKEELSHFIAITSIIFLPGKLRSIQLWNSLSLYYATLVILCLALLIDAQGGSISSRKRGWEVEWSTRTLLSEAGGKNQRYLCILEKYEIKKLKNYLWNWTKCLPIECGIFLESKSQLFVEFSIMQLRISWQRTFIHCLDSKRSLVCVYTYAHAHTLWRCQKRCLS